MKEYSASTTIDAPAETIWACITNAAAFPEFDPWAERIEGTIEPGAKLKAYSKLSPGRGFPARVTEFVPNRHMEWTGGMPLGLFKGVRTFDLTPEGEATAFALRERFSGPLLPLIGRSIPDMTEAFGDFVQGLKRYAEGQA